MDHTTLLAEPFRFTQGWGSAGTITVALVGIAVSAWFNRKTLTKADNRHNTDRMDAYKDAARKAIADISTAVMDWGTAMQRQRMYMKILADELDQGNELEAAQTTQYLRDFDSETQRPAALTLHTALISARLLTSDSKIAPAVNSMLTALIELRPTINAADYSDTASLRGCHDALGEHRDTINQGLTDLLNVGQREFEFHLTK
ncbi:hypothetical protein [Rhodococcus wratislaviensis]|uniref:hypothetical protein n=1 Tax=Rhodococcus wratislaviensis TaxID=44752 RepID=UPI003652CFC2